MGVFSVWHWLIVLIIVGAVGFPIYLSLRTSNRKTAPPQSQFDLHAIDAPQIRLKRTNFVATHWRGEFPLWVSYWVIGFLGNIALAFFVIAVNRAFSGPSDYNPLSLLASTLLVWSSVGIVAIWQLVGVWRSSNRYSDERHRQGKNAPWAALAKFAVLLGTLRLVSDFASAGVPQIQETWRIAFFDDPSMPPYALRVMRNGTEIEVAGGIKYGLHEDFLKLLDAAPLVRVIHFDSIGGRIGEALKLHKTISERRLTTYVAHQCDSACTLAFVGGHERWIAGSAKLGFHLASFPGVKKQELLQMNNLQRNVLLSQGVSRAFVDRALSTSSKDMWYPTTDELLRAGVISGVAKDDRFAASGLGRNTSRTQAAAALKTAIPALGVLEERNRKVFDEFVAAYYEGYLSGETQQNLNKITRSRLLPIIQFNLALADNETVIEFGKLLIDQYEALAKRDSRLCYEYASGTAGPKNFVKYLPKSLLDRELVLGAQVLRTSTNRPVVPDAQLDPYWTAIVVRVVDRLGAEKFKILSQDIVQPADYSSYCEVATELYREMLRLEESQAVLLLRHVFRGFQKTQ